MVHGARDLIGLVLVVVPLARRHGVLAERPVGEDDAEVEVVGGVGAVGGHAAVDDGRVGAAGGVEQQAILEGLVWEGDISTLLEGEGTVSICNLQKTSTYLHTK